VLSPLAPHLAEEVWETLGGKGFVIDQKWPTYDPAMLVTDTIVIVVQVNGKVRGQIEVAADASQEEILKLAKEQGNVVKFLEGKAPKKEIYVKGKLVSFVM
jgi:leucyl-tRNA synthetase